MLRSRSEFGTVIRQLQIEERAQAVLANGALADERAHQRTLRELVAQRFAARMLLVAGRAADVQRYLHLLEHHTTALQQNIDRAATVAAEEREKLIQVSRRLAVFKLLESRHREAAARTRRLREERERDDGSITRTAQSAFAEE